MNESGEESLYPYFELNSSASESPHTSLLCFLVLGSVLLVCLVLWAKMTVHRTPISALPDCEILCIIQFQSLLM